jgi:hypothetical protein
VTADGGDMVSTGSTDDAVPFLRVVKGEPTPEELAALVAVLASLGSPAAAPTRRTPEWNAPRRLHRVVQPHGPSGWRSSGLPR